MANGGPAIGGGGASWLFGYMLLQTRNVVGRFCRTFLNTFTFIGNGGVFLYSVNCKENSGKSLTNFYIYIYNNNYEISDFQRYDQSLYVAGHMGTRKVEILDKDKDRIQPNR